MGTKKGEIKLKKFEVILSLEDKLTVRRKTIKGELKEFSINYSSIIHGKWKTIYRIDNCHGYIHEQRYWQNGMPKKIDNFDIIPLKDVFNLCLDKVKANMLQYKEYYTRKLRKVNIERWQNENK